MATPKPGTIEARVLAGLRAHTDVTEGGWHSRETVLAPGLTADQVRDALYRLRRKGHTFVERQAHPDGAQRWLWFPMVRV